MNFDWKRALRERVPKASPPARVWMKKVRSVESLGTTFAYATDGEMLLAVPGLDIGTPYSHHGSVERYLEAPTEASRDYSVSDLLALTQIVPVPGDAPKCFFCEGIAKAEDPCSFGSLIRGFSSGCSAGFQTVQ